MTRPSRMYSLGKLTLPEDGREAVIKGAIENLERAGWLQVQDAMLWCCDEAVQSGTNRAGNELSQSLRLVLVWLCLQSRYNEANLESILDTSTAAGKSHSLGWPSEEGTCIKLKERGMITSLFDYQLAAVEFMGRREDTHNEMEYVNAAERGWRIVGDLVWHPFRGVLSDIQSIVQAPAVRGGCLFDEVGLGKTLITLSLVLLRPAPRIQSLEHNISSGNGPVQAAANAVKPELSCLCGIHQKAEFVACKNCGRPHHITCWSQDYEECTGCELLAAETCPIQGGTLIVCPKAIAGQWLQEAQRHCPTLKVIRYWGLKNAMSGGRKSEGRRKKLEEIRPSYLCKFDVVLVTYDVLRDEFLHASTTLNRRYALLKSPLRVINWHRLCLDEAQMVEGRSQKNSTKLAHELRAHCRWCITGTPVQRGMSQAKAFEDLVSLLVFLRAFSSTADAIQCLGSSAHYSSLLTQDEDEEMIIFDYEAVLHLMQRLAWRATKQSITLNIPHISVIEQSLEFTPVESIFYNDTKRNIAKKVADLSVVKNRSKDLKAICQHVATHLQALRQACCHPSAVNKKKAKRKHGDNGNDFLFLTLDQVHTNLCLEARTGLENEHRAVILQRNALTGLVFLKAQHENNTVIYEHAARLYTATLSEMKRTRGCVEVIGDVELIDDAHYRRRNYVRNTWAPLAAGYTRIDTESSLRLVAIAVRTKDERSPSISLQVKTSLNIYESVSIQMRETSDTSIRLVLIDWTGRDARPRGGEWRLECDREIDILLFQAEADTDVHTELHAIHNLLRILESRPGGNSIESMDEDWPWQDYFGSEKAEIDRDELQAQVYRLENNELKLLKAMHSNQRSLLDEAIAKSEIHSTRWREASRLRPQIAAYGGWERFLEDKFRRALHDREIENDARVFFWLRFPSCEAMCNQIASDFAALDAKRASCLTQIESLSTEPSLAEQTLNFNCQYCRSDHYATGPKCNHCKLNEELLSLESSLFFFKNQRQEGAGRYMEESLEGSAPVWRAGRAAGAHDVRHGNSLARESLALLALEALAGIAADQTEAKAEVTARKARMTELASIKKLWNVHHDLLSELDTLRGAKLSYDFATEAEINATNPERQRTLVPRSSIILDQKIQETIVHLKDALREYKSAKSNLRFKLNKLHDEQADDIGCLTNDFIERVLYSKEQAIIQVSAPPSPRDEMETENAVVANASISTDICPVCMSELPLQRAVLSKCSHELCCDCAQDICNKSNGIRCPTCRKWHQPFEVIFPLALKSIGSKQTRTFGTKLATIVADIENVLKNGDKVLIFSEWDTVNDICVAALKAANLDYEQAKSVSGNGWESIISRFHSDPDLSILILNVKTAAAGLNLTAANHIFFIHPLLSKSDEMQAIGRVHRIGQKKPVVLHHYSISNTVEPTLRRATQRHQMNSNQEVASKATGSYAVRAIAEILQSPEDIQQFFDLNTEMTPEGDLVDDDVS